MSYCLLALAVDLFGHGYGFATSCFCVVFKAEWPSAGSRPLCEAAFNFWHLATWFLFVSLRKSFCSLPASKALTRRTLLAQVCLQARFFLVLLTLCPCDRLVGPHMKASTMLLNKVVFLHVSAHWYPNFNVNIFCLWLSHEFLDPQFSWYSL